MADLEALLRRDYEMNGRRSFRRARAALANVAAGFGPVDPARTYPQSLAYAARRRLAGAAPATIRYEMAIFGRAMTLAFRSKLIRIRPDVARPRVQNARQGFVPPTEVKRLMALLPEPIQDVTLFAYVTGWRKQEILGLIWSRVEPGIWSIMLPGELSKNAESRVYPAGAHPGLRHMLEARWHDRRGAHVFHRSGQRVLHFSRSWETACRKAGLGHTLFHSLRRSAVRNMERAGVPRSVAMQLSGFKTESVYRRYAITNEEDLARGVRLIAALSPHDRIRHGKKAMGQGQARRTLQAHDGGDQEAVESGEVTREK